MGGINDKHPVTPDKGRTELGNFVEAAPELDVFLFRDDQNKMGSPGGGDIAYIPEGDGGPVIRVQKLQAFNSVHFGRDRQVRPVCGAKRYIQLFHSVRITFIDTGKRFRVVENGI